MKTTVRTIILTAASLFAAMSCQKEAAVSETQNLVKAGETIQVSINAGFGDLVAADGTKAEAKSVVRLEWDGTETVQAYCGAEQIGTDLTVTPSENGMFAKLTGTITAPEAGKTITFVYSSGCQADGLVFDFSDQTSVPFVAYGTLEYDGNAITDKMVEFKFATSVMKIAATNLGGNAYSIISKATISGINTKVTLTPSDSGAPEIAGSTPGNIATTTNFDASSDVTRAIITVGLVPDSNTGRNIAVKQTLGGSDYITNKGVITSAAIEANKSYTTPASLFPCGTLGSGANAHDYVLIAGTKWATQNLAVSASGQKPWKSVYVPGTEIPVQVGDFFQWGAYEDYTTASGSDKGLLIYTAFTHKGCGDSSDNFTFKSVGTNKYWFSNDTGSPNIPCTPYYDIAETKYTEYNSAKSSILAPSDDVARILWQDTWRMPTSAEFQALCNATYWKWDGTDKGYYVYAPQTGDAGKKNSDSGVTGTYDTKDALLFFPATGKTDGPVIGGTQEQGYYWSSTLFINSYSGNPEGTAYDLSFNQDSSFDANGRLSRPRGFSVRPVSD